MYKGSVENYWNVPPIEGTWQVTNGGMLRSLTVYSQVGKLMVKTDDLLPTFPIEYEKFIKPPRITYNNDTSTRLIIKPDMIDANKWWLDKLIQNTKHWSTTYDEWGRLVKIQAR